MESTFSPEQGSKFLRHCILLVGAWDPYIKWLIIVNYSVVPFPSLMYWQKLGFCHCSSVCCLAQPNHPKVRFGTWSLPGIWRKDKRLGIMLAHKFRVKKCKMITSCFVITSKFLKFASTNLDQTKNPAKTRPQQKRNLIKSSVFWGLMMMDVLLGPSSSSTSNPATSGGGADSWKAIRLEQFRRDNEQLICRGDVFLPPMMGIAYINIWF